jgi:hypothetical protein
MGNGFGGLEDGTERPNLPRPWTPQELDDLRKHGHPRSSVQRKAEQTPQSLAAALAYAGIPQEAAKLIALLEQRVAALEGRIEAWAAGRDVDCGTYPTNH